MIKVAKLIIYSFLLYVFFAHFTPFIVQFFPSWQAYVDTAEEHGIEPGALYYTDVPVALDAAEASRRAIIKTYGSELGWKPINKKKIDEKKKIDKIETTHDVKK